MSPASHDPCVLIIYMKNNFEFTQEMSQHGLGEIPLEILSMCNQVGELSQLPE